MQSNKKLVEYLVSTWVLKNDLIIQAFLAVDRGDFVLTQHQKDVYDDIALSIWYWVTISQPTTVWLMLEWLNPKKWDKILDVWSGSGWTTALLWYIVWNTWYVYWVEIIPQLVKFWNRNIKKYKSTDNLYIYKAGISLWLPNYWPYDKILVSASAQTLPLDLVNQLKINWKIVIPIQDTIQVIKRIDIKKYIKEIHYWFRFVPLIS